MTIVTQVAAQQKEAQGIWHFVVADSVTAKGIAGVTIAVNNGRLIISDPAGGVDIDKKNIGANDNFKISCVGYRTKELKPGVGRQFPDTIKLSASITVLNEVIVGRYKVLNISAIQKKYNTHRVPDPSTSSLQFIPNTNKVKGIITTVTYVLNDELHGIERPFRLRLFSKTKGSLKPDRELITDSVVVYNPERKQVVDVDISKYDIAFPEDGVIAVFETLPASAYGADSIWYNKPPREPCWLPKMPGIEMDLKKKDNYLTDPNKDDRITAYSAVGPPASSENISSLWYQWYVFLDDDNFAITIAVKPTDKVK